MNKYNYIIEVSFERRIIKGKVKGEGEGELYF